MKIVVATSNLGKITELASLLPGSVQLLSLADVNVAPPIEDGTSFLENALIKARAAAATGFVAIADDSGLEVNALCGAPGVHSSRYAGDDATDMDNNAKLLTELADVPSAARGARFRSVVVLVAPGCVELTACGAVEGHIATTPRGEHGFGYDPLFVLNDPNAAEFTGLTMAELEVADKNRVSHRGRAYRNLMRVIAEHAATHPELFELLLDREREASL
jgi:XTP/dITP diphosphohydrolase